jgi:hypothetical protein
MTPSKSLYFTQFSHILAGFAKKFQRSVREKPPFSPPQASNLRKPSVSKGFHFHHPAGPRI